MKKIKYTLAMLCFMVFGVVSVNAQCTLDVSPAITVQADDGLCGADLTIPLAVASADCQSIGAFAPVTTVDFNDCMMPAGWVLETTSTGSTTAGACAGSLFSFMCTNGLGFSTNANANWNGCIATINDDDAGSAVVGVHSIVAPNLGFAPVADMAYQLSFDASSDDAFGANSFVEVTGNGMTAMVWENTTTGDFTESPVIDITAFMAADMEVSFVYDDGGAFAWGLGIDNVVISEASAVPAVVENDYNAGGADASDVYPVGTTTVTYTVQTPTGAVTASVDVTVEDNEGPTLDCPDDFTFQLDPGECAAIVSYEITAEDDCGLAETAASYQAHTADETGLSTFDMVYFDIENQGTEELVVTQINQLVGSGVALDWQVYSTTGTSFGNETNAAAWTLIGEANVTAAAGTEAAIPLTTPITVPAGGVTGVAVGITAAQSGIFALEYVFPPVDPLTADANGVLVVDNGATTTQFAGTLLSVRGWAGSLDYLIEDPAALQQTDGTGFTSGDEFPIGVTVQSYSAEDANGNVSTCEFEVTVLPFQGAITSLACNDNVNISVDENCEITFNADMFLEGGPYACYDDYEIYVWPFNNENAEVGDLTGASVPFGSLLGNHTYRIVDPTTGNECWGYFLAEDKLAPQFEAFDYTISCIDVDDPKPVPGFNGSIEGRPGEIPTVVFDTTITFEVTSGCTISDVNVELFIDHTWAADMTLTVTSPQGTSWDWGIGCIDTDADFTVDDEGMDAITLCADLVDGLSIPPANFGSGPLSVFDGELATGIWTLEIADNVGGDGGQFDVNVVLAGCATAGTFPDGDACGNTTYTFSDVVNDNDCDGQIIERTWFATDASGNTSDPVSQTVTVERIGLADILLPPALIELTCGAGTEPMDIVNFFDNPLTTDRPFNPPFCTLDVEENNEGNAFGFPYYMQLGCDGNMHPQRLDNNVCEIFATYTDQEIPACGPGCDGNVKVIRTWTLLDWCTNEQATYTQLIKAVDSEGPTFFTRDVTVSTDPWGCTASFDIDMPWELHDNCDFNPTYTVSGPAGVLIAGNPTDGYTAVGAPKGVHTFIYTATDCCGNVTTQNATVTVLDQTPPVPVAKQNIVISLTSSSTSNDGSAKLFAESIDNGSHDGCTDVYFETRRDEDICNINGNTTYNADGHPQDGSPVIDTDNGQWVKFCCEDITNATVDVNGDGVNDAGYVRVWLRVWDDGDMDGTFGSAGDNYNETWTFVKVEDKLAPAIVCPPDITITCDMDPEDLAMTGDATGFASCGAAQTEYNDIITNLSTCNEGFIRRRFNVVGRTDIFCDQTITVEDIDEPVTVSFNGVRDNEFTGCPDMVDFGEPTWVAGPCDVLGYTVETDTFRFEDGACYKLVNHWTVINWCDYEPNNPLWNGEGLWEHVQVIKFSDETLPVIETCESQMFAVNDAADVDGDGNVCEAKITLTNSAFDPGTDNCPTGWLKWQVFVDLWADGTNDLEYSSFLPPFDSQFNDTNGNGIPDVYLMPTENNGVVSVSLPDIEGSMSNHKIVWKVTDGCGNIDQCTSDFMVVDKKAPTPYCVSLSTAVMEMGANGPGVELWASDFNIGSFDNCTAQENLLYSFSGDAYVPNRTFDCDDVANSPVEVQMWVWDEKENRDFCQVFLTVVDNQELCGTSGSRIASGNLSTENGDGVANVETTIEDAVTGESNSTMSNDNGLYVFTDITSNENYITGYKNNDWLNGVSTKDLVKIQRHILGLEYLNSPYKVIAADINKDEELKATDLVVLRKLILGVISEVEDNESWRFVDATQVFADPLNPTNIDEVANVSAGTDNATNIDMVAVKVGDVSDDAVANATAGTTTVVRSGAINLVATDRNVEAGEEVTVEFTSGDFQNVFGYQFTLELDGAEFAGVNAGVANMTDGNVGVLRNNVVTVSYSDVKALTAGTSEAVFSMTIKATKAGLLSEMIDITSKVVSSEAYVNETLDSRDVNVVFRGETVTAEEYGLAQNEPNPFRTATTIEFTLPQDAAAQFSVFTVDGKLVHTASLQGTKGVNQVILNKSDLNASGVLFYTIESGDFSATKKMIIVE